MHGSYGAVFGIIAGSIGIVASKSINLSQINGFWIAHVVMVRMHSSMKYKVIHNNFNYFIIRNKIISSVL